jgi:hypothetical protein
MIEKSVREQLLEARANIQRQIDILRTGQVVDYREGPPQALIADLMATLREIDDNLADLGQSDVVR